MLGFDLELVGSEVEAGPYKADIEARIPQSGECVIIENQLTPADPRHLGQLLHYHARLKARRSVWVAPSFYGTNLDVIDWLNRSTGDSFYFYAVRVSVNRDRESGLAPIFEVFRYPEGWKDVRAVDFWAHLAKLHPDAPEPELGTSARRARHWLGKAELKVVQHFMPARARVYLTGRWRDSEKDVLSRISRFRDSLEAELMDSGYVGGKNERCRTQLWIDTQDKCNWNEIANWLHRQRETYVDVLREGQDH